MRNNVKFEMCANSFSAGIVRFWCKMKFNNFMIFHTFDNLVDKHSFKQKQTMQDVASGGVKPT